MGREQGDHLGEIEAVTYVGTVNGVEYQRVATTPADHVNLRARGWVTAASLGRSGHSSASTSSTASPTTTSTSEPASPQGPSDSTTVPAPAVTDQGTARRGGKRAPDVVSAAPQDEAAAAAGEAG